MKIFIKKTGYALAAIILIFIGLIGILLPIMPGWLFVIPGILLLAKISRRVDKRVNNTKSWINRQAAKYKVNFTL